MTVPIATGKEPCRVAPDRWFPGQSENHMTAIAKQVCLTCPILEACREWGIRHELFGVWGGLSRDERHAIRKLRRIPLDTPQMGIARSYRSVS